MTQAVEKTGQAVLDYQPWGIEGTKLQFRGPSIDLDTSFIAVLGGTETYGKYVSAPFPTLLQDWLDAPIANLGVHQAGLTLFSEEQWLLDTASRADLCVFQVLGAQNMSNRLYSVHARRNDRFLAASSALRDMYPDVDFAEINFTGHLLETLLTRSPEHFSTLVEELKWAWVQRMRRIVKRISCDVLLLWVSDRSPDGTKLNLQDHEPMFVDRQMLADLSDDIIGVVEVVRPGMHQTVDGMVFAESEMGAAECLPGPSDHTRTAEALAKRIADLRNCSGAGLAPEHSD